MADSKSGAAQVLTIGSTALEPEDGATGFTLNFDPSTFDVTSGGLMTTQNAGPVTAGGSFSCLETTRTAPHLLGQNGARVNITWNDGTADVIDNVECVIQVSRQFDDRGARMFNVTYMVDGAPS